MPPRLGDLRPHRTHEPDVPVLTDPAKIAAGVDEQLLAAGRVLLDQIGG